MTIFFRAIFVAVSAVLAVGWAQPADAINHQFQDDSRPHVLRFACCEDIDIRDAPVQSGNVVGQLRQREQVHVYNLFGPGLPSGLAGCLGTGAPCGTLWAEILAVEQGVSGFVPLNALFIRDILPQPGRLQYEIGFQRLFDGLDAGLQDALVAPEGCGDPANVTTYRGSDLPGDWVLSPSRTSRQSCGPLLEQPKPFALVSCEELDPSAAQFDNCRYRRVAECRGDRPGRAPSGELSFCQEIIVPERATCSVCREWYALTGQDATGWQTVRALVDGCLAGIPAGESCGIPSGGGGGGGGGVDVPSASGDLAPLGGIPDGEFDPLDQPGVPEPLEAPSEELDLAAGGQTQAGSDCNSPCQDRLQTFWASSCRGYIGSADTKRLADHEDYECGEIPVGKTHPLYFLNMDTGEMSGSPDPDWKWLTSFQLDAVDKPLIVRMGRVLKQRSFLATVNDLSRRQEARPINFASRLGPDHVWVRVRPISRARLELEACVFLPGVPIDTVPVRPDPTSTLGLFVEEIDFGRATLDRIILCQPFVVSVNDDYRFEITPREGGSLQIEVVDGTFEAASVRYTPVTDAATVLLPVGNIFLAALQLGTSARLNGGGGDGDLAEFVLTLYADEVRETIVDGMQDAIDSGTARLNRAVDIPEMLGSVCGDLAPVVGPSNPTFWFNEFLRWQCEGFAADPNLRAFQGHEESEAQGCYGSDWYINPRDAGGTHWWTPYAGQSWAFNLTGTPDRGCRVTGEISSDLDRDTWPTLICAMTMHNFWLNGPNFPQGAALRTAIQSNCGGFVNQALGAYYGSGDDLIDLYAEANAPGTQGMGGLTTE